MKTKETITVNRVAFLELFKASYDLSRKPVDEDDAATMLYRLNAACAVIVDCLEAHEDL